MVERMDQVHRPSPTPPQQQQSSQRQNMATTIWRFSRPHTLIGTALSIPAIYLYAAPSMSAWRSPLVIRSILYSILCSGFANLFITGLNQLTDVDIDRINKPELPLVSGQMSKKTALIVLLTSLAAAFELALRSGSLYLVGTIAASIIMGALYSLPPFRWKRNPILAALCIVLVRGLVINVGFYGDAITSVYGQEFLWMKDHKCLGLACYFAVFGSVIALCKDIPDVAGDRIHGINSLSVRFGVRKIFSVVNGMVQWLMKAIAVFTLSTLSNHTNTLQRLFVVLLACGASVEVEDRSSVVSPYRSKEVYKHYMFIWKLFYLSYLLLPILV